MKNERFPHSQPSSAESSAALTNGTQVDFHAGNPEGRASYRVGHARAEVDQAMHEAKRATGEYNSAEVHRIGTRGLWLVRVRATQADLNIAA